MAKTLTAYFSASGVTANVAKVLAEAASADIYEIKPETAYTKDDLDYMNPASRSSVEMKDKTSRPAIIKGDVDMSAYDTVFLDFRSGGLQHRQSLIHILRVMTSQGKRSFFSQPVEAADLELLWQISRLPLAKESNHLPIYLTTIEITRDDIREWMSHHPEYYKVNKLGAVKMEVFI